MQQHGMQHGMQHGLAVAGRHAAETAMRSGRRDALESCIGTSVKATPISRSISRMGIVKLQHGSTGQSGPNRMPPLTTTTRWRDVGARSPVASAPTSPAERPRTCSGRSESKWMTWHSRGGGSALTRVAALARLPAEEEANGTSGGAGAAVAVPNGCPCSVGQTVLARPRRSRILTHSSNVTGNGSGTACLIAATRSWTVALRMLREAQVSRWTEMTLGKRDDSL